jgi:hypothetical protein
MLVHRGACNADIGCGAKALPWASVLSLENQSGIKTTL